MRNHWNRYHSIYLLQISQFIQEYIVYFLKIPPETEVVRPQRQLTLLALLTLLSAGGQALTIWAFWKCTLIIKIKLKSNCKVDYVARQHQWWEAIFFCKKVARNYWNILMKKGIQKFEEMIKTKWNLRTKSLQVHCAIFLASIFLFISFLFILNTHVW